MGNEKIIQVPKWLITNFENAVIGKLNYIYSCKDSRKPDFYLNFSYVEKVDLLGLLILYKFLEYSVVKNCFINPTLYNFDNNKALKDNICQFGFKDLINKLRNNEFPDNEYWNLKVNVSGEFIIAPMALLRDRQTSDFLNKVYSKQIKDYYQDEKTSNMIFGVFTEILLNFQAHAVDDQQSIIVAHGNKDYIEIACADSGIGIIDSITTAFPQCKRQNAIPKALQKEITSKKNTFHMGYGLWSINEIVCRTRGKLMLHSDRYIYENLAGKVKNYSAAFWQGTIVYVKLPLDSPITIDDLEKQNYSLNSIKINFQ